jgi:hypothetical protein
MMDNAESIWHQILEDPYSIIRKDQEESLFLDFIRKSEPGEVKANIHDRKNYAKALSGFSNASGGVIVWGPSTRGGGPYDVVTEVEPIPDAVVFETQLNGLTAQATIPMNAGVLNQVVPDGARTGFVVTYVPASDMPPLRALLQVDDYCIRCGSRFQPMEHYMIADAFGRRRRPALRLEVRVFPVPADRISFPPGVLVSLVNTGRYLALYPAIAIDMSPPWSVDEFGVDGNFHFNLAQVAQAFVSGRYKFVGGANSVVHPTARFDVCRLNVGFGKELPRARPQAKEEGFLEFSFAIYAQDCEPVQGVSRLDSDAFYDLLDAEPPSKVMTVPGP